MSNRLVDYHINRLKDKNPDVRLKSVKELELIGQDETLDILRELYENDPDPTVRKAAQNAGREIYRRLHPGKHRAE